MTRGIDGANRCYLCMIRPDQRGIGRGARCRFFCSLRGCIRAWSGISFPPLRRGDSRAAGLCGLQQRWLDFELRIGYISDLRFGRKDSANEACELMLFDK